jgi:hypothetical protein
MAPLFAQGLLIADRRALLIRNSLACALTSLAKFLANNLRDQTLAKKWKFKKPTHLPIIMYTNLRLYNMACCKDCLIRKMNIPVYS